MSSSSSKSEPITGPGNASQAGRSTSVPPRSAPSSGAFPRSSSVDTHSGNISASGAAASRGRSLTRNRDLYRKRSSSVDGTTPVSIVETDALREQNGKYNQLRSTSANDVNREWNHRFPEGHILIYTDGSAICGASGMGIYMGPGHPLNRAQRTDGPPHDSNRTELLACILALQNLRSWPEYRGEPVIIRTDSLGVVYAMKGHSGGPPFYRQMLANYPSEIEELRQEVSQITGGVRFEHVYAHADDPGNDAADILARQTTVGPARARSNSRDRSRERGRRASMENNPGHIRSHSAEVKPGQRTE